MTSHAHARKEIRPGSRTQTAELAALQPPALAQRVRKQREGVGGARWCLWELRVESLAAGKAEDHQIAQEPAGGFCRGVRTGVPG